MLKFIGIKFIIEYKSLNTGINPTVEIKFLFVENK